VISSDLGISVNTLKTHIRNIYSKCSVKNRKELLMLSESGETPDSELTLREKEILRLIILGKTNQEITSALCISNNTVRVHIWNICTKLGVKNRNDLMEIRL
jgi:DNA-binding CsgD family transcriptional regulator